MIRFLKPLYTTEKMSEKTEEVCDGLENGALLFGTFVITLSETEADVFDIYNGLLFKQPAFRNRDYDVIGLAESEEAAYELVSRIYSDFNKAFGTYNGIKSELINRLSMQETEN